MTKKITSYIPPQTVSVKEAAQILHSSTRTVYRAIHNGKLRAIAHGEGTRKIWLLDREEVLRLKVRMRLGRQARARLQQPVEFINLMPHPIHLYDEEGAFLFTIPPSGRVAHCEEKRKVIRTVNGVPVYYLTYSNVQGLPEPQRGKTYIVSPLVLNAIPLRDDVYAPGPAMYDKEKNIIGHIGLSALS